MGRNRPRICPRILEWRAAHSCIRGLFADGLLVRRLSMFGEVESAVEVGLVRAGRLRQSVLRSAFEGRL